MSRLYLSAVAAVGESLGSQRGGLSPPRIAPENALQRSGVLGKPGPLVTIASLVPHLPGGSLVGFFQLLDAGIDGGFRRRALLHFAEDAFGLDRILRRHPHHIIQ